MSLVRGRRRRIHPLTRSSQAGRLWQPPHSSQSAHRHLFVPALALLVFLCGFDLESEPILSIAEPGPRYYAINDVLVTDDETPLPPGRLGIVARGWDGEERLISTMHLDAASHRVRFRCYLDPDMASLGFVSEDIEQRSGFQKSAAAAVGSLSARRGVGNEASATEHEFPADRGSASNSGSTVGPGSAATRQAARGEYRLPRKQDPQAALMAFLPEPARRIGWSRRAFTPAESLASDPDAPWQAQRRQLATYMEDFVHSLRPEPAWASLALFVASTLLILAVALVPAKPRPGAHKNHAAGSSTLPQRRMWLLPTIATASGLLLAALAPGQGSVYAKDAGALSMMTTGVPILRALPESGAPEASGAESEGLEAVGSSGTGTVGNATGTAAGSTETEAARSVHAEAERAATGSAVNADFVDISTAAPDSVPEDAIAARLSAFVLLAPGSRRVALDALLPHPGNERIRFGSPQPRIVMEGSEAYLDADGFVAGWVLR